MPLDYSPPCPRAEFVAHLGRGQHWRGVLGPLTPVSVGGAGEYSGLFAELFCKSAWGCIITALLPGLFHCFFGGEARLGHIGRGISGGSGGWFPGLCLGWVYLWGLFGVEGACPDLKEPVRAA